MSFTNSTTPMLAANNLPQRLAAKLSDERRRASPAPSPRWGGIKGGVQLSPELSYGRHAGPPPHTALHAAVLVLLFQRDGRWHLPLTERPPGLARHAGQISLPGGRIELDETSSQAALRELEEELGAVESVELLGQLADSYVFASDFVVTPWVAATTVEPRWRPHDREVERVIELPLEVLLQDDSIGRTRIERGPLVFYAPCIQFESACIWGATSVILGELREELLELEPRI